MDKVFGGGKAEKSSEAPIAARVVGKNPENVDLNADTVPLNDDTDAVALQTKPEAADAAPVAIDMVDVEAKLDELEKAHPEDLDWKKSIVDLCKLLDIDSSYGARKEMALELGYTQEKIDCDGSAEMNLWLHKTVMAKIAENGGKLPAGLAD